MPQITSHDGTRLYFEETGHGTPILFVHEFLGDYESWEAQLRYFSRKYRCIAYNARGYPPSDVPDKVEEYSFEYQRADLKAMLDALKIDKAHIVGLSMGAFATFYFGMKWPKRALSLTLAGIGSGAIRGEGREKFQREAEVVARRLMVEGWEKLADIRCTARTRVQLQNKSPRAFASFVQQIKRHSGNGSALTLTGYQVQRPSLEEFKADMVKCRVPTLIICGDEDEPCMDTSVMLKRHIPSAGLVFMPQTGHACNIEEPELFNMLCEKFFHQVESGQYRMRDPRAIPDKVS